MTKLDWDSYELADETQSSKGSNTEIIQISSDPNLSVQIEWPDRVEEVQTRLIYQGNWDGRFFGRKFAGITLPDDIPVSEEETIKWQNESGAVSKFFKGYSYYLIMVPIGLDRKNWGNVRSFTVKLKVENTSSKGLIISMPIMFPTDNLVKVGERIKEYTIGLTASGKGPNTDSLGFSVSAGADLKAQNTKKIKYDLRIPRINAFTNGNNDAQCTFFEDEAIDKVGQFRIDMLVGLPKDEPKTYHVRAVLSADVKFTLDPKPIIHNIPIKFME